MRGVRRLWPMSVFVVPFGVAFGVAALEAGMSPLEAVVISALTFSGAAQFAALDFWPEPGALASLAFVVLALNARHVIMGAALSLWVNRVSPGRRILSMSLLSDANFADAQHAFRTGERDLGVLVGGGAIFWLAWVVGTAMGAFGGEVVGRPAAFGVDVVMPCFFPAMVVSMVLAQPKPRRALIPVGAAMFVSVATAAWLPAGWNVIAGALAGGALAAHADV